MSDIDRAIAKIDAQIDNLSAAREVLANVRGEKKPKRQPKVKPAPASLSMKAV